jgi:HEAT repeat protein
VPQKPAGVDPIREWGETLRYSRDPVARKQALGQLNKLIDGVLSSGVVDGLRNALRDPDEEVRLGAVRALAQLRPVVWEVEPDLIRVLREDESPKVRGQAAAALGRLAHRPRGQVVVPHLLTALQRPDNDKEVLLFLIQALARFGGEAKAAVPALLETLEKHPPIKDAKEASLGYYAVQALGNIGPAAAEAVPTLLKCLQMDDAYYRREAMYALGGIGIAHPDVLPALRSRLTQKDSAWDREAAARALTRIGLEARAAVPDLLAVLAIIDVKSPGNETSSILEALARIDPTAKGVVPAMTAILQNKEAKRELRQLVVFTLAEMGPAAKEAVPALIEELRASRKPTAVSFLAVKKALQAVGAEAVPALVNLVSAEKDNRIRRYAIEVLGQIGPPAKAAIPALRQCLDSPDDIVRERAADALKRIEKSK